MMANNQDARPFVDLRKDAEEFQTKFNEDIEEIINFLNAKISALICDPDSLGDSVKNVKQNTLMEFSKSKYDIFLNMKALVNRKEKEWLDYILEMKKLFIENVEIFLAGTKLEVKLPSSEYQSSFGFRKSPGNRKSITVITSSSLKNIAKSIIPALNPICGSETSNKDVSSAKHDVQSYRSDRLSAKLYIAPSTGHSESMESSDNSDESETGVSSSLNQKEVADSSESSETEARTVANIQLKKRGRQSTTSIKLSTRQTHAQEENDMEMDTSEVIQQGQRKNVPASKDVTASRSGRGRRGKQSAQNVELENATNSVVPKKLPGRSSRLKEAESNPSSEETAEPKPVEAILSQVGRRGKSGKRNKVNNSSENQVAEDVNGANTEESTVEVVSARGRRGRSAAVNSSDNDTSGKSLATRARAAGRKNFSADETNDLGAQLPPVSRPTKSSARRKTMLPNLEDVSNSTGYYNIPGNPTRSASKRKTISGVSELNFAAPPKRSRVSNKKDISSIQEAEAIATDNLLENDENYSEWMALKSIDGKIPTLPAVYEVKVWRAKKSAYIGSCENLHQKLILYKLRQNSGHKHLDKFLDRNYDDIQVRFEVMDSIGEAKCEEKIRVKRFVDQFKTTPAYN